MTTKIQFFSSVPGLAETFPIKPAKEVIPKWVHAARTDYLKQKDKREIHIFKCPGIFELFGAGYIIPAWHDFEIECNEVGFRVTVPDGSLNDLLGKETLQSQHADGVAKFLPTRPWSVASILKINTPWHVMAPKGVKFLMIPLPYTDDFKFESCSGILDPGISSELNIQGYWNEKSGKHIIKAGTPLAQLIPITEKNYDFIVRDKNDRDDLWLTKRKYLNFFGFSFNRPKIKESYERHNDV